MSREVAATGFYATRYREVHPTDLRSVAKHICLSSLAGLYRLTGRMRPLLSRNRVQFLYMHQVFEDEVAPFRRLLQALSRRHRFISYSEAVERIWSGRIDSPYVAFSFDDGIKNCAGAGEVMDEFGVKACFFICPPMAEESDTDRIKQFCRDMLHKPPMEFLSWDDMAALLDDGHEIGGHSMTHRRMNELAAGEAESEIRESFELLAKRLGAVRHFSWPYARLVDFTARAARAAFEAGFETCAAGTRGCHVAPEADRRSLCIRRDDIRAIWPAEHTLYFMARNSRRASPATNEWPEGWLEIIRGGSSTTAGS